MLGPFKETPSSLVPDLMPLFAESTDSWEGTDSRGRPHCCVVHRVLPSPPAEGKGQRAPGAGGGAGAGPPLSLSSPDSPEVPGRLLASCLGSCHSLCSPRKSGPSCQFNNFNYNETLLFTRMIITVLGAFEFTKHFPEHSSSFLVF